MNLRRWQVNQCYVQRSIGTAPGIAGPHLDWGKLGKLGRLKPGLIIFLLCLFRARLGLWWLLAMMIPSGLYFEINILVSWSFKLKNDMDDRSVFNCLVIIFHVVTDLCEIELRPYLVVFLLGWNRHPNLESQVSAR